MQQRLSDVLLMGGICFAHREISNIVSAPPSCFLLKRRKVRKVLVPAQHRWAVHAALKFGRCECCAGEEITLLLRFVISDQLPAGGAASSQMTRVASGIVATATASWKAYTQKCLCLVTLLWACGSDILVEGGGDNCCTEKYLTSCRLL